DQVVGARRADLAYLGRSCRRGECDCCGAPVDLEHDAFRIGEERAAERRKRLRQEGEALALPELRARPAAQTEPAAPGRVHRLGSSRDELDGAPVCLLGGAAPRDEAVALEQDGTGGRMRVEELG